MQGTRGEERAHGLMCPFPKVVGNERRDGDDDKDQKAVEADLAQRIGQICEGGFGAQARHVGINDVVQ